LLLGWYLDEIVVFLLRKRHFGIHERAFFLHNSAEECVKQFIPKWKVIIRYSADNPHNSFVSAHDQVVPPVWATRYH
jgi:hypothetical protein